MKIAVRLLAAAAAFSLPAVASAQTAPNGAVTITFAQSGADVVETATGFFNTSGLSITNFANPAPSVYAGIAATLVGNQSFTFYTDSLTGPNNFGPGGQFLATSASGDSIPPSRTIDDGW